MLPGGRWESKLWLPDRLAELIDLSHADGLPPCVLLGAQADKGYADSVVVACRTNVYNLVGRTTLRELVALLDLSKLVICYDSGPMHIAAALNKPLVAIFGPTDLNRTGPYSSAAQVVSLGLDCIPCLRRNCPLGHHACMRELEAEMVFARVLKIVRYQP